MMEIRSMYQMVDPVLSYDKNKQINPNNVEMQPTGDVSLLRFHSHFTDGRHMEIDPRHRFKTARSLLSPDTL